MGETRRIIPLTSARSTPGALREFGMDKDFMDTFTFVAVALFILTFGLVSRRIQKTIISPPMVFVLFGMLVRLQYGK